jgi:LacI family transcriptional regulator
MIADISNPFYSVCAKAVEEVARERGYMVILCASDEDVEVELMYVDMLTRRRVEGLLLVPAANGRSHPGRERLGGLPIVALDRPIEDVPTDTVLVQNRSGAREGIKHLIDHGHQRIAFVGTDARVYTARERLEGYREALREAGLQEFCSIGATDIASAARSMKELLDLPEPPTAVFGVNNLITIGVLQALDQAGLRVPEDMALIGFDDFELASVLRPRLTVIRQPVPEIGRRAAELLFEQLKDGPPVNTRGVELATELVIRESCGCSEGVVVEEPPVTSLRHASP